MYLILSLALILGVRGASSPQFHVLATTSIVADVVAQIAAPEIRVESLIPPGSDPHGFEPAPKDVQKLLEALLIFTNGVGLEAGLSSFLALPEVKGRVVDLSQGLPLLSHEEGEPDPHVWWNPHLVALWTEKITEELSSHFPQLSPLFRERARRYQEELAALDRWIREETQKIPEARRLLVTDHYVLGYFAARYGFTVAGALIPSHETLAEPSARALAELEGKMRDLKIPAIFVSPHFNPALAQRVAQDTGAKLVFLPWSDVSEFGDYIGLMREAVRRIVEALGP